jgi:hypothetical protein
LLILWALPQRAKNVDNFVKCCLFPVIAGFDPQSHFYNIEIAGQSLQ